MLATTSPFPFYADKDGTALDNGSIYYGLPDLDPQTSPIAAYWDASGMVPASQPIKTINGFTSRAGTPALVYVSGDFSTMVRNRKGEQVSYSAHSPAAGDQSPTVPTLKQLGAVGDGVANDGPAIVAACANNPFIIVGPGTYLIASDTDCGTTTFIFQGGMFVPDVAGRTVTIRKQVQAGDYQIFGQTGDILVGGQVNPMWFGLKRDIETLTQAKINTRAARCACKSYKASFDKIVAIGLAFSVKFPAGMFAFANGFCASVGVSVTGAGASDTYFRRIFSYVDGTETAIPLLTIGKTFDANLVFNPNQDVSPMSNFGSPYPAALASDLYFTDQSAAGAFAIKYPGAQASNMFFTSCAIGLLIDGAGDITLNNFIFDLGLTGVFLSNCQNIVATNFIIYNTNGQAMAVGSNVRDVMFNGLEIEYPVNLGIFFGEGATGIRNFRIQNFSFIQNIQYDGFQGMCITRATECEVIFSNGVFRNIHGAAFVSSLFSPTQDFTFENVTFDGRSGGYTQGNSMSVFLCVSGTYRMNNCVIRDQYAPSYLSYGASLYVDGLKYFNMNGVAVFDITGISYGGQVKSTGDFNNVTGDGIAPLLKCFNTGMYVKIGANVRSAMGAPYAYQTFLAWDIPLSANSDVIVSVVSARTNNALAIQGRKSSEYRFERSIDYIGSVLTDQITTTKIAASAAVGGYPELAQAMKFVNDQTTQGTTNPNPTIARLLIPNTYGEASLQLSYIG